MAPHFLKTILTFAGLSAALQMAPAQGVFAPTPGWNDTDEEWFNKNRVFDNDKDGDEELSGDEVKNGGYWMEFYRTGDHFDQVDANNDDHIDHDEMRAFNETEKNWWTVKLQSEINMLMKENPDMENAGADQLEGNEEILKKLLSNSVWVKNNEAICGQWYTNPGWMAAHPEAALALLSNQLWLVQFPKAAYDIYTANEALYRREIPVYKWIRKHKQYIEEYHQGQ